jgi:hypothetical protein
MNHANLNKFPCFTTKTNILYKNQENGPEKESLRNIPDCFLEGLNIGGGNEKIDDQNYKNLEILQQKLNTLNTNLPIYLINAHGLAVANIILFPPKEMKKKKELKVLSHSYNIQLLDGFGIKRVENYLIENGITASKLKSGARKYKSDFFELPNNVFHIGSIPVGYDGSCRDLQLEKFLDMSAMNDDFEKLRDIILSTNALKLFSHTHKKESYQGSVLEFENSIYTPPNYSTVNKRYSFSDNIGTVSQEKYGIYKLDNNYKQKIGTFFQEWGTKSTWVGSSEADFIIDNKADQLKAVHPNSELYREISESIKNDTKGLYLSEIVEKLGPGIYIDVGCSGIVLNIYERDYDRDPNLTNPAILHKENYYPEDIGDTWDYKHGWKTSQKKLDINKHPGVNILQNIIYQDYNKLQYYNKFAWNNMFLNRKTSTLTSDHITQRLIDASNLVEIRLSDDSISRQLLNTREKKQLEGKTLKKEGIPNQFLNTNLSSVSAIASRRGYKPKVINPRNNVMLSKKELEAVVKNIGKEYAIKSIKKDGITQKQYNNLTANNFFNTDNNTMDVDEENNNTGGRKKKKKKKYKKTHKKYRKIRKKFSKTYKQTKKRTHKRKKTRKTRNKK